MSNSTDTPTVAEFQGLYGPFHVSEILIQKIWSLGLFDTSRLVDHLGRRIEIESPGRWNRLDGPDFKDAVILFDGERVFGDVEIHFAVSDWEAHGHSENPAFDNVILHVVYHPLNDMTSQVMAGQANVIPCLSLMEYLWHDLEEYVSDDSILVSTGEKQEAGLDDLFDMQATDREQALLDFARERWKLKVHFSSLRIAKLGWTSACHHTGLEIMGFSQNRVPMLEVASRYSIEEFLDSDLEIEKLFSAAVGKWKTQGVRPANYPRLRLNQYANWVKSRPSWPDLILSAAFLLPEGSDCSLDTLGYRRQSNVNALRSEIAQKIVDDQVAGSKLDTLVCDGFLPLLAARLNRDYFSLWFHWFPGNAPESCVSILKRLQIIRPRVAPLSNGWIQGVIRSRRL